MLPYGTPLNQWRVVPVIVPMNILQRIASYPYEIIIWALKTFKCPSRSSTPEKGVIFGVIKWGGIVSSIIAYENGWGLSLSNKSGERVRMFLLTCRCTTLRNSSFAFYSYSLPRIVSSIILQEQSTSSWSRFWLARDSSRSARASSYRGSSSCWNSYACHFTSS